MRRAARVDANHSDIVDALRDAGCSVWSLAGMGQGCPDLMVYSSRRGLLLFEVKDGSKPPSARKRTPLQLKWAAEWKGPVYVINSVDEALTEAGVCHS